MYFDDSSRRVAAENLYESLVPGGFICLGHTESMSRISSLFDVCRFDDAIVYQRPKSRVMSDASRMRRVLVVDDAALVRRYVRQALEPAGFEVEESINGIDAMEKVLAKPFDLLVVDINMPKMDGYKFLHTLRAGPAGYRIGPGPDDQHGSGRARCRGGTRRGRQFLSGEADGSGRSGVLRQRDDGAIAVNALLDQFLLEARELVQEGSDDLVALERAPDDPERLERAFRAFHTLKGGAAIVNLPVMTGLVHAGEDVLAALRSHAVAIDRDVIDAALRCMDQVGQWLDDLATSGALPADAPERADVLTRDLRRHLPQSAGDAKPASGPGFDWVDALVAATPGAADEIGRNNGMVVAIAYEPNEKCFFSGDDPIGLLRKVQQLLALTIAARSPWRSLADLDPFACNLTFRALALAPRAQVAEIFRYVSDQVRIAEVAPDTAGATRTAPRSWQRRSVRSCRHSATCSRAPAPTRNSSAGWVRRHGPRSIRCASQNRRPWPIASNARRPTRRRVATPVRFSTCSTSCSPLPRRRRPPALTRLRRKGRNPLPRPPRRRRRGRPLGAASCGSMKPRSTIS